MKINTSVLHRGRVSSGFTLVELLIVIVIIVILATLSIITYNGIQNRTADSIAQSDIDGFLKKISLYTIDSNLANPSVYASPEDGGASLQEYQAMLSWLNENI